MAEDKRIDGLVEDVREMRRDIGVIKDISVDNAAVLRANTTDVAHHIKRTDLLETSVAEVLLLIKSAKLITAVAGGIVGIWALIDLIRKF